jgi:hypothetical protein
MNERIKELAEQAEMAANKGDHVDVKIMMAKFAELIVLECIKLNGKELAMPGHSRMVDVYCEHFGIEE